MEGGNSSGGIDWSSNLQLGAVAAGNNSLSSSVSSQSTSSSTLSAGSNAFQMARTDPLAGGGTNDWSESIGLGNTFGSGPFGGAGGTEGAFGSGVGQHARGPRLPLPPLSIGGVAPPAATQAQSAGPISRPPDLWSASGGNGSGTGGGPAHNQQQQQQQMNYAAAGWGGAAKNVRSPTEESHEFGFGERDGVRHGGPGSVVGGTGPHTIKESSNITLPCMDCTFAPFCLDLPCLASPSL